MQISSSSILRHSTGTLFYAVVRKGNMRKWLFFSPEKVNSAHASGVRLGPSPKYRYGPKTAISMDGNTANSTARKACPKNSPGTFLHLSNADSMRQQYQRFRTCLL